jgi:hypothetical protein
MRALSPFAFGVGVWDIVSEGTPGYASSEGSRGGCSNDGPVHLFHMASLSLSSRF